MTPSVAFYGLGMVPHWDDLDDQFVRNVTGWISDNEHRFVKRDKWVGGVPGEYGERRRFRDRIMDSHAASECLGLSLYYRAARQLLEKDLNREVWESPFPQSAITIKLYQDVGCEHGWHVETNSLTLLIYLENVRKGGGQLEMSPIGQRSPVLRHLPTKGEVVLLKGNNVWHRAAPMLYSARRLVVVMNYYFPEDVTRPQGLDRLHYA